MRSGKICLAHQAYRFHIHRNDTDFYLRRQTNYTQGRYTSQSGHGTSGKLPALVGVCHIRHILIQLLLFSLLCVPPARRGKNGRCILCCNTVSGTIEYFFTLCSHSLQYLNNTYCQYILFIFLFKKQITTYAWYTHEFI